jgi:hypothetical protein
MTVISEQYSKSPETDNEESLFSGKQDTFASSHLTEKRVAVAGAGEGRGRQGWSLKA